MRDRNLLRNYITATVIIIASLANMTAVAQENAESSHKYNYITVDKHNAVNLGLSVCWADCNVGANYPTENGGLYGWADVTGRKTSQINDFYPSANPPAIIWGNEKYDIARYQWGGKWRLPTLEEFNELINKCTWELEVIGNSTGYIVTGPNGNRIFLPLAGQRKGKENVAEYHGCYWSGTGSRKSCHGYRYASYGLSVSFSASTCLTPRFIGQSVRPVIAKNYVSTKSTTTTSRSRTLDIISDCPTDITDNGSTTTTSRSRTLDIISDCPTDITGNGGNGNGGDSDSDGNNGNNAVYPIPSDSVPDRTPGYNGPHIIDLGLSVKWADRNYGAKSPSDYGQLAGWGDPTGKEMSGNIKKYTNKDTPKDIAGTEKDIAAHNWKRKWRMPTKDEMKELVDKCKWEWTTRFGTNGYLVTGPNGNSIFLPAAGVRFVTGSKYDQNEWGRYWTSTQKEKGTAWILMFDNGFHIISDNKCSRGYSIRPVWK